MAKKYKSDAMESVHKTAAGLYKHGLISKERMRMYDKKCYAAPIKEMTPKKIQSIRKRESASQAEFATILNVSEGSIRQWERGASRPAGSALKLLTLVEKNGLQSIAG